MCMMWEKNPRTSEMVLKECGGIKMKRTANGGIAIEWQNWQPVSVSDRDRLSKNSCISVCTHCLVYFHWIPP